MLEVKEGIFISMADLDGLHVWQFKFRYDFEGLITSLGE